MDTAQIAELLKPFTPPDSLSPRTLEQLQRYLDLLLRWNARIALTAVRDPGQIVTRHFGESLFAAQVLFDESPTAPVTLADLGSGAGFPGIPMKLFAPEVNLTLIESHNKKAVFLREVVRTLSLDNVEVFCGRAEQWGKTADVVTLRAVEHFQQTLPIAASLAAPSGNLCLLIGSAQIEPARHALAAGWKWRQPKHVPGSASRVVLIADRV
jgi:16S rRNA (guanine527-N7)-methyltransferase